MTKSLDFLWKKRKIEKKDKKVKYQFTLGFFEYIYYFITLFLRCKKTNKQRLIDKANQLFTEELDVIKILTKIHEIEKLKRILLNQDQLVLFNSLAKPLVLIEDNDCSFDEKQLSFIKNSTLISEFKANPRGKTIFRNSYDKVKCSITKSKKNKRLMNLVEDNINNINKLT